MTKITLTNSVAKFGGTSVRMYYNKIYEFCNEEKPRFVVVSAPGKGLQDKEKLTDILFSDTASLNSNLILSYYKDIADEKILETLEKELRKRLKSKNKDDLYAFGEWASAYALSTKIGYEFIDSKNLIFIKKNNQIDYNKTYTQIRKVLSKKQQCIIPGFYGSGENGKIKILDRGGSDTTGALIACALRLDTYENITDFCLHAVDPRIIKNVKKIDTVTAAELRAIVSGGSNIISTHAVAECVKHKIPITIRNINKYKKEFTTINNSKSVDQTVTAITGKSDLNTISISWIGLNETPNVLFNISKIFREHSVSIEHVTTGTDEVVVVFEYGIFGKKPKLLKKLLLEIFKEHNPTIEYELMDFVSVVGIGLKNNLGILSQITKEISKTKTSVKMVFQPTSELNIAFGMKTGTLNKVVTRLYKHFFCRETKEEMDIEKFNEHVIDLRDNFLSLHYIKGICMQYGKNVTANICGKDKAEEQRNCMGKYGHFFEYAEKAAFVHVVVELSKFFDKDNTQNKTLSIYFLLKKALKIPDLNEEEQEKIKNFEKKLKTPETKKVLKNLRILRNKYVVHNDLKKTKCYVSDAVTFDYLLENIDEILCYFLGRSFGWNSFKNDGESVCKKVVEDLVKYNKINKLVYDIDTLVDGLRGDDKDKWKNKIKKLILKLHKELFDKDGNTVITTEKYAKLLSEI